MHAHTRTTFTYLCKSRQSKRMHNTRPTQLLGFFAASALWSFGVLLPVTTAHAFITPVPIKSILRQAGPFPLFLALCSVYALALETLVDLQKFIWCVSACHTLLHTNSLSPARAHDICIHVHTCTHIHTYRHQHHTSEGKEAGPLTKGLFEIVRYPNYLAEITFWTCITGLAASLIKRSGDLYDMEKPQATVLHPTKAAASGVTQLAPIIQRAVKAERAPTPWLRILPVMAAGPAFLTVLLLKVSGVPPTDAQRDRRYGHMAEYRRWKENVPAVFPSFASLAASAGNNNTQTPAVTEQESSGVATQGAAGSVGSDRSRLNFKEKFRREESGGGR